MLTIPAEIQALYKRDSVRKNFRVHFPNGEMADITNANIVQESVTFTESLCSQEVLKFGLTEASCIEFETVGIGNMFGMTIQCYDEIDTSSLTTAQLTAIQADPGDGVLVLEADSDLGYGYYQIPLGVFYVDKCPRNHGAMTHRRVTAYTQTVNGNSDMSAPAQAWLAMPTPQDMPIHVKAFLLAALGDESTVIANGFTVKQTRSAALPGTGNTLPGKILPITEDAHGVPITALVLTPRETVTIPAWAPADTGQASPIQVGEAGLLLVDAPEFYETLMECAQYLEDEYNYPIAQQFADGIYSRAGRISVSDGTLSTYTDSGTTYYRQTYAGTTPTETGAVFYLESNQSKITDANGNTHYLIPATVFAGEFRITRTDASGTTTTSFTVPSSRVTMSLYTDTSGDSDIVIQAPNTLQTTYSVGGIASNQKMYTRINSISYAKLLAGWLELQGKFGKFGRTGAFEMDTLDGSSPVAVLPGEYSEMWWDEYDVSPVGAVKYAFGEDGASNTTVYQFGTGTSVYDMTDNYLLQHMADQTETTINALLDSMFIPNIADIAFTPVDLEMMGYPQMEAGDALSITAEDGTIVNTFAMRQEFAGIQMLTNTIESTGGEIIDAAGMTGEET